MISPFRTARHGVSLTLALLTALTVSETAAQTTDRSSRTWPEGSFVEITFLDVGQGDAVVVRSPEGRTAMIDGGRGSPLRHLQRMGVDSLALLVASHPHADHIGGLDDILTARPVAAFMDNGEPHTTATYQRLMATVERLSEVTYLQAEPRTLALGSVSLEVLPLPPPGSGLNNRSVGLLLRFGAFTALLSGDSEEDELDGWTARGVIPRLSLLKAPHHGSDDGFTQRFLEAARPEVVVISAGRENTYGHPRPEALTAYAAHARRILRTDRHGSVTVLGFPDGRWEVMTERGGPDSGLTGSGGTELSEGLAISVFADAPGNDHEHLNGEYVTIENRNERAIPIGDWTICDLSTRCFRFPSDARIAAGRHVRVYTGFGIEDGVSFFMNNDRAVWNNDGDEAVLYDSLNTLILRYVY